MLVRPLNQCRNIKAVVLADAAGVIRDGDEGMPSFQATLTTEGIDDLPRYNAVWLDNG